MKTILVPFHDHDAGRVGLETAAVVANRFGSYMEGLLVQEGPHVSIGPGVVVPAEYLTEIAKEWRRFADAAREQFVDITRDCGIPRGELESEVKGPLAGWREMDGREAPVVGEYGRLFDLIVVGRSSGEVSIPRPETCEAALFESGRPILVTSTERPRILGDSVVIAWNGSTETARTVALTMAFLLEAKEVVVLTVESGMVPGPSGRELAAHLLRNGVAASAKTIEAGNRSVGEAIIDEAVRLGADLLVKGAYTRNRLRQIIFGGATQHILNHAPIPVLMAH
jgi:nucleotide-binding universal stress UspA family protein